VHLLFFGVPQELEDTISSLRMQVSVLQQRIALVTEDLEARTVSRVTPSGGQNCAASSAVPTGS
jgi:hypothetical protein